MAENPADFPSDLDSLALDKSRPALNLGSLADRIGFHLRRAHFAMYRRFMTAMTEHGVTQMQSAVLELIRANPGVSQVDLAAALSTDRATMMAIVDKLDTRGLIARTRSDADRRRQELVLTEEGASLLATMHAVIEAHESEFLKGFSKREVEALLATLRRLHEGD